VILCPESSDLLSALPGVLEGVALRVVGADGVETARYGGPWAGGGAERRFELPVGEIVASLPVGDSATIDLVEAMLGLVTQRERLESDMDSMNRSSLRLLEQVAMLTESLPRLSAASEDADLASLGARACQVAAGVQHVIYLGLHATKNVCEVLVHHAADESAQDLAAGHVLEAVHTASDGLLAEVLAAADGVVLRSVPADGRLGQPGSPEHLARRQFLGVPVTYGAGDKRVVLGALLLLDKRATSYAAEEQLGNEEGQVAESFAAMLGAVLGARKTAALGKELSMAQAIQRQILPERAVVVDGFDVAADYEACGAVGGDYFDYVSLADGRTLVVVADVSGHNLASGMMMVSARATLRTLASVRSEPAQVFEDLAATMYGDLMRTERFLTAAAVALRPADRSVEYVSAGHNDLYVYRAATDRVEAIASESTILGFLPRPGYTSRRLQLQPGDCLLLFTDGITEAMDAQGEMFGDERLAALLAQVAPGRSARGIVDAIVHELHAFRGAQVGSDDVTAVVIRCVDGGGRR
jgi:serine phosphatase RsbU (regulator of sigma subunit)